MKGRKQPDAPTDCQCKHCGLYYDHRGISNHEPSCFLREFDTTIQEVETLPELKEPPAPADVDADSTNDIPSPRDANVPDQID
ncbi:hypothetical protein [Haloferax volcanii]|uniref:hypothetical protein n=1 Tax=Haloferax volcanii TaxID=2246 RepID=UPI0026DEC71C|nr:hypothetical protein [Haloferax alexandrinus]